jgi:hypothetical protein
VFREVQVQPRRLHMTEKLMLSHSLEMVDCRDHVPVAEVDIAICD